jgi:hypothetical protein
MILKKIMQAHKHKLKENLNYQERMKMYKLGTDLGYFFKINTNLREFRNNTKKSFIFSTKNEFFLSKKQFDYVRF